jgi:hypothetical protein
MPQPVDVNGKTIQYPIVGESEWGVEATDFAVQVAGALAKIGQSTPPATNNITIPSGNLTVTTGNTDLGGTLDVTGATTLDSTLDVTGATTLDSTLDVTGATTLDSTLDVTGVTTIVDDLIVDTDTLFVDVSTDRVGINTTTPTEALDVTGKILVSSDITVGGVIVADDSTNVTTAPPISFTGDTDTGIGRSAANTLDLVTGGQPRFRIESTGQIKAVYESTLGTDYNTQLDNGYLCRAWVNFDGTGTPTIRASGNISSITDRGTGEYTANLANQLPDLNYCGVASATIGGANNSNRSAAIGILSTSSFYINSWSDDSGNLIDVSQINGAIFR